MNLAPDCLRINGKRVVVEYDPPPILHREFDYRATFIDGDDDSPRGYGATAIDALADLKSWDDLADVELTQ